MPANRREQPLDQPHGVQQPALVRLRQRVQHVGHLLAGARVEGREQGPSGLGEREQGSAAIQLGSPARDQAGALEPPQDAAEIAGVELEVGADLGGCRRLPMRQLVQHAAFRQRQVATEQPLAQHADPSCVEAVEASDPSHPLQRVVSLEKRHRVSPGFGDLHGRQMVA